MQSEHKVTVLFCAVLCCTFCHLNANIISVDYDIGGCRFSSQKGGRFNAQSKAWSGNNEMIHNTTGSSIMWQLHRNVCCRYMWQMLLNMLAQWRGASCFTLCRTTATPLITSSNPIARLYRELWDMLKAFLQENIIKCKTRPCIIISYHQCDKLLPEWVLGFVIYWYLHFPQTSCKLACDFASLNIYRYTPIWHKQAVWARLRQKNHSLSHSLKWIYMSEDRFIPGPVVHSIRD